MSTTTRLAIAAVIVWIAAGEPNPFNGGGGGGSGGYSGPLKALHREAEDMKAEDRKALSAAMQAASDMLDDDKANLIKSTKDLQEFVRGTTAYGYSSFSMGNYPDVADEIQKTLEDAVGDDIEAVSERKKSEIADTLEEIAEALL